MLPGVSGEVARCGNTALRCRTSRNGGRPRCGRGEAQIRVLVAAIARQGVQQRTRSPRVAEWQPDDGGRQHGKCGLLHSRAGRSGQPDGCDVQRVRWRAGGAEESAKSCQTVRCHRHRIRQGQREWRVRGSLGMESHAGASRSGALRTAVSPSFSLSRSLARARARVRGARALLCTSALAWWAHRLPTGFPHTGFRCLPGRSLVLLLLGVAPAVYSSSFL